MGIRYYACDNPECNETVCEADPKIKNCEHCGATFCGDYGNGSCASTVLLECKDNKYCKPEEEGHETPPHTICIGCHEGSWPSEKFDLWLLKRAGYLTKQEAQHAYDTFNGTRCDDESSEESSDAELSSEASSEASSEELSIASSDESSSYQLSEKSSQ